MDKDNKQRTFEELFQKLDKEFANEEHTEREYVVAKLKLISKTPMTGKEYMAMRQDIEKLDTRLAEIDGSEKSSFNFDIINSNKEVFISYYYNRFYGFRLDIDSEKEIYFGRKLFDLLEDGESFDIPNPGGFGEVTVERIGRRVIVTRINPVFNSQYIKDKFELYPEVININNEYEDKDNG